MKHKNSSFLAMFIPLLALESSILYRCKIVDSCRKSTSPTQSTLSNCGIYCIHTSHTEPAPRLLPFIRWAKYFSVCGVCRINSVRILLQSVEDNILNNSIISNINVLILPNLGSDEMTCQWWFYSLTAACACLSNKKNHLLYYSVVFTCNVSHSAKH